ncbi:hypothetical protein JCM10207_008633 [Rhodosporidiobolus poonsookiae]
MRLPPRRPTPPHTSPSPPPSSATPPTAPSSTPPTSPLAPPTPTQPIPTVELHQARTAQAATLAVVRHQREKLSAAERERDTLRLTVEAERGRANRAELGLREAEERRAREEREREQARREEETRRKEERGKHDYAVRKLRDEVDRLKVAVGEARRESINLCLRFADRPNSFPPTPARTPSPLRDLPPVAMPSPPPSPVASSSGFTFPASLPPSPTSPSLPPSPTSSSSARPPRRRRSSSSAPSSPPSPALSFPFPPQASLQLQDARVRLGLCKTCGRNGRACVENPTCKARHEQEARGKAAREAREAARRREGEGASGSGGSWGSGGWG